jgi:excisionase family DNA binding protein
METGLTKQINDLPDVVEADEIASLLRVTRQTVIRWANEGLIPVIHPADRTMRFLKEDVRVFVAKSYGKKR